MILRIDKSRKLNSNNPLLWKNIIRLKKHKGNILRVQTSKRMTVSPTMRRSAGRKRSELRSKKELGRLQAILSPILEILITYIPATVTMVARVKAAIWEEKVWIVEAVISRLVAWSSITTGSRVFYTETQSKIYTWQLSNFIKKIAS